MKKIIIAAALLVIGASAHAGTYNVEGVTIHVQDGCASSSCVSVYAPGYGYYHGEHQARAHKAHKDSARVAAVARKDDVGPATVAPAVEAAPGQTQDKVHDKAPDSAPQAAPTDTTPAR